MPVATALKRSVFRPRGGSRTFKAPRAEPWFAFHLACAGFAYTSPPRPFVGWFALLPSLVQPVLPPIPAWGPCFHPGSLAPLAPNPPSPQPDPPAQCPQPPQPRSAAGPALSFASQDCFGLVGGSSSFLSPHFRSPVVFGRDQRREKKCPTS